MAEGKPSRLAARQGEAKRKKSLSNEFEHGSYRQKKGRTEVHSTSVKNEDTPLNQLELAVPVSKSETQKAITISALESVEYHTAQLINAIDNIIKFAPSQDINENILNSDSLNMAPTRQILRRPKVQLAIMLKDAYTKGNLSLFDSIRNYSRATDVIAPPKFSDVSGVFSLPSAKHRQTDRYFKNYDPGNQEFPKLPELHNKDLEVQVFTHKSASSDKLYLSLQEKATSSNERLEFLGDALLGAIVTELLFDRFPFAKEGYLTNLRSQCVCNDRLRKWAEAYGFPSRLVIEDGKKYPVDEERIVSQSSRETSQSIKERNKEIIRDIGEGKGKIFADALEAYIAAVTLDSTNGHEIAVKWISKLVEPIFREAEKKTKQHDVNENAKNILYSRVGSAQTPIEYQRVQSGNGQDIPFIVHARINGTIIGKGSGRSEKDAKTMAAMDALNNEDVIEKFASKRRETPRSVSRVKEGRTPIPENNKTEKKTSGKVKQESRASSPVEPVATVCKREPKEKTTSDDVTSTQSQTSTVSKESPLTPLSSSSPSASHPVPKSTTTAPLSKNSTLLDSLGDPPDERFTEFFRVASETSVTDDSVSNQAKQLLMNECLNKPLGRPIYEHLVKMDENMTPIFEANVYLKGVVVGKGVGRSKRVAERKAASVALNGIKQFYGNV